jgi:excisionase family DNA binding protein
LREINSLEQFMLKDNRVLITTPQAAEQSGLSKTYLTQLLRKGTLEGFQLGREWLIYADSLEHYLATPHKSGPKGPRKKKSEQEPSSTTSTSNSNNSDQNKAG